MVPRRDGQRLERREKAAGSGTWATGLVAQEDRGSDRRPAGDGRCVSARRGRCRASTTTGSAVTKTGQRQWGVHRLDNGKTGQWRGGVHQLDVVAASTAGARTGGERVRAVPRDH